MANIDYASLKKGGFMRQKQKGYFSLRIQVVGGNLTAENIKAVAEVAEKYGKGYVHMTSLNNINRTFTGLKGKMKYCGHFNRNIQTHQKCSLTKKNKIKDRIVLKHGLFYIF